MNWVQIVKGGQARMMAQGEVNNNFKVGYPTSNKNKTNWDQIDKNIKKDLAKEKPEGDEALNNLFKEIYGKADEETRRAMIKSYQTSGGTVLSTNWGEVKEKDYEGRDKVDPPEG